MRRGERERNAEGDCKGKNERQKREGNE